MRRLLGVLICTTVVAVLVMAPMPTRSSVALSPSPPLAAPAGLGYMLLATTGSVPWDPTANPPTPDTPVPATLLEIDPVGGATVRTVGDVGYIVNGLEYDTTTGKLYGSTSVHDPTYNGLIEIDLLMGVGTPVGVSGWGLGTHTRPDEPGAPSCCAVTNITVNASGQMFGWSKVTDELVEIDKTSGIATPVGDPGEFFTFGGFGLDFDNLGRLRLISGGQWPGTTGVYNIDVTTGAVSLLGVYDERAPGPHHGDFEPVTNLYYAVGPNHKTLEFPPEPKALIVVNIDEMRFVEWVLLEARIHDVTFVGAAPLVPFVSFAAKVEIHNRTDDGSSDGKSDDGSSDGKSDDDSSDGKSDDDSSSGSDLDRFKLSKGMFVLGGDSDGIDLATEDLTLEIGPLSMTILAGVLEPSSEGDKYKFNGVIDDVKLKLEIKQKSPGMYEIKADGTAPDLSGVTTGSVVRLTIGDDTGEAVVTWKFK